MRDSEVVASIVAGDPAGLAAAYDRYAGALFGYCRSLLREPADAADVVHDTFVIAAVSMGQLRDPDRLRPWLYAVARNLALRKLRADKAAAVYPALEADGDIGEIGDAGAAVERAELRALLQAATGGLNPRERDIIELRLWQDLDIVETAAVLGTSPAHANSLLYRARNRLTTAVGVLLVARAGRQDCAELDGILKGWDGHLTVLMRKRLSRHIEHCETCSDRRDRELRPAMLTLWPAGRWRPRCRASTPGTRPLSPPGSRSRCCGRRARPGTRARGQARAGQAAAACSERAASRSGGRVCAPSPRAPRPPAR